MNYYPHHIGDYAKDTAHLSMLEDAAYRRMLDVYYSTEKPLPIEKDKVYRLVRARSQVERTAVEVVLGEFFTQAADGWHNPRADEEIAKAQYKSNKARGSAAKRWQSERMSERNAKADANAMRTHSEGNAPNNQEPKKTTPLPPSGAFISFWATWPQNERKGAKGKCWALWRRSNCDAVSAEILAHVETMKSSESWRNGYCPAPLVYLNQRRWEGAEAAPEQRRLVAL